MRIPPTSLSSAHPLIRALLPALRTTEDAARELRWLRAELPPDKVYRACVLRGKGYPLQYILGTQPFGPLEIKCARKVLIPRWETEEWALKLANDPETKGAKVLDLCTGSGCVLFLLASVAGCTGTGVDISPYAERLFHQNEAKFGLGQTTQFLCRSVFEPLNEKADIVTANPPYVDSLRDVDISVRKFEPRLALLDPGNVYRAVIDRVVESDARKCVLELGTEQQATDCVTYLKKHGWTAEPQFDAAGKIRSVWGVI